MSSVVEEQGTTTSGADGVFAANTAFILVNSALVFVMTPALGFFYSGLSSKKNALSNIMISMFSATVVTIQWLFFGFSLSFSESYSPFIGDHALFGLNNVGAAPLALTAPTVPAIAFCLYQLQFAVISAAIIFGSVAERIRVIPAIVFIFFWTTFVYDVIAYWTWGAHGWLKNLACLNELGIKGHEPCFQGALDFAGGGPVHIASGFSGLAYCLVVGKRKKMEARAHNLSNVVLGTALLWMGWYGFNGGSALAASPRAAMAIVVTTISAAFAGAVWAFVDFVESGFKRFSVLSLCSGIVAGLVAMTPSSGFVMPWAAAVIGIISGLVVNFSRRIKNVLGFDDTLDAFGIHGIGGALGVLLTGFLHQKSVDALDGTNSSGGAPDGNWITVWYQIVAILVTAGWAFVVSLIILLVIDRIPGLKLRCNDEQEDVGMDFAEFSKAEEEEYIGGKSTISEIQLRLN